MNSYLQPSLRNDFAHYVVRTGVLRAVQSFLPSLHGTVVDLGSGNRPYQSLIEGQKAVTKYIAIDWQQTTHYGTQPDLYWDGKTLPLEDGSVDCVLLTEVVEHLEEPFVVTKEIYRVLKPGGLLAGTTPFVWPLHEVPHDRQRFTPFGVQHLLEKAEFDAIELSGAGGWRTALAQFLSAYAAFGIGNPRQRAIAQRLMSPLIKSLVKNDRPVTRFVHTGMVNMTIFKATKPA